MMLKERRRFCLLKPHWHDQLFEDLQGPTNIVRTKIASFTSRIYHPGEFSRALYGIILEPCLDFFQVNLVEALETFCRRPIAEERTVWNRRALRVAQISTRSLARVLSFKLTVARAFFKIPPARRGEVGEEDLSLS